MGAPEDRVRLIKNESPSTGGTQDDIGFPSQLNPNQDAPSIRGFFLQKSKVDFPIEEDELVYVVRDAGGNLVFRDNVDQTERTLSNLLAGGGITEASHKVLDQLQHNVAENSYQEIVRSAGKVVNVILWTNSGKTTKIRELAITRSAGKVSQLDVIQYDASGVELVRITGVVARTSGKVSSITWTETIA